MTKSLNDLLAETKRICEAATPAIIDECEIRVSGGGKARDVTNFIAHACEALPRLVAALEVCMRQRDLETDGGATSLLVKYNTELARVLSGQGAAMSDDVKRWTIFFSDWQDRSTGIAYSEKTRPTVASNRNGIVEVIDKSDHDRVVEAQAQEIRILQNETATQQENIQNYENQIAKLKAALEQANIVEISRTWP